MITITSELLVGWEVPNLISDELLPMGVMGVFDAPISSVNKVQILLREEVLDRRGLVYVVARAVRRACTKTKWSNPDSLRALDLCDRYAAGEEIPKEYLEKAAEAASKDAVEAVRRNARAASNDTAWAARAIAPSAEDERKSQLTDCREWLMRVNSLVSRTNE
jgi:hypothetical protein